MFSRIPLFPQLRRRAVTLCAPTCSVSHPCRAVWTMDTSIQKSNTVSDFLDDIRTCCASDPEWMVDFSKVGERAARLGLTTADDVTQLYGRIGAVLATCPTPPQSLQLTLSDPNNVNVADILLGTAGVLRSLLTLRLYVHSTALRSADTAAAPRMDEDGALQPPEMQSLAKLFQTVAAVAPQLLHTLDIVSVDSNMDTEVSWNDTVVGALAELLGAVKLNALRLNYINCQACTKASLLALTDSLLHSKETLQTLDLKGMRAFLHYSSFFTRSALPQLSALQSLDISYTHIGDVAFRDMLRCLHKGVGGWHRLTSLALAQCNLGEYAIELLSRGIQETDGEEPMEVLIESLNVNSNQLQDDTIFLLAGCLVQCKHLKVLDMRFNSMTKKSAGQLASSLMHASDLRVLRLRSNRIGDDGLAEVIKYVKYWPALEELDLTRCRLTSRSLVLLAEALPYLPELRVLSVSGNDLRPLAGLNDASSAEELKLFAYDPSFMKGDAFHNRGDGKVPTSFELDRKDRESGRKRYKGPEEEKAPVTTPTKRFDVYQQFGEALSLCRQLQTLDVSDTSLQDESFTGFAGAAQLPALKELRLGANPLFAASVSSLDQLAAMISGCTHLELLDLAFTGLGDLGLSLLCDGSSAGSSGVLCSLKQLRVLQLSHCRVKSLGLEALAARVPELHRLEKLLFDGNRVSLEDLIELLARTTELSHLEHLTLSECGHSGQHHRDAVVNSDGYMRLIGKGVVVTL